MRELKINELALERIKPNEGGSTTNQLKDKQLLKYFLEQETEKLQADTDLRFSGDFQYAKRMLDRYRLMQIALEEQYLNLVNLDNECIMGPGKMLIQKKMYKALRRQEETQQNIIQTSRHLNDNL